MKWIEDLEVGDLLGLKLVHGTKEVMTMIVISIEGDVLFIKIADDVDRDPGEHFSRTTGKWLGEGFWNPTLIEFHGSVINLGDL